MKYVADTRKQLGIPTIFNLLAPLLNPARARHQLLGVFAPELTDRLAAALRELGSIRAWVVHADDGLDEISTLGPTRISELRDGHVHTWTLDPKELGIDCARLSDLQIASLDEAAKSLTSVLKNDRGPKRDIALLNAAAAIFIAEKAGDLNEGLQIARKSLDEGKAAKALETLITESNAE
jgi:anthranilate phosphoribosyltransferase